MSFFDRDEQPLWPRKRRARQTDPLPTRDGSLADSVTLVICMSEISQRAQRGTVYLVGAGPGDPELITVHGLRLIQSADVIFYDHLAPVSLLDDAPARAETVYVGKKRARRVRTQQEISQMLIDAARAGRRVVRLKGGDPYIFGRGV